MNEGFNDQQLEESTKDNIEALKDYVNINTCVDGSFQDISKLIVSEVKELFVFSNNTFYGFDEEFKIWKEINENVVKSNLSKVLFRKITDELKNISTEEEEDNKIKLQKKIITANKIIGNPDSIKKIMVYLYEHIIINKFEEKLNRSHDYILPVKNNICINLVNGDTVERTKEHYFTFCH